MRGTVSLYVDKMLAVPALSAHGSRQLATDVGYLINILSALGIADATHELDATRVLLEVGKDEFATTVTELQLGDQRLARGIATIRGFK